MPIKPPCMITNKSLSTGCTKRSHRSNTCKFSLVTSHFAQNADAILT